MNKRYRNQRFCNYKFFPKSRKGFLLGEETLKIIVAVICIVLLIYLLVAIYFSKVNDNKLVQAEALLKDSQESIKAKISALENTNSTQVHLFNPKGWYLFSFVNDERPNSCAGKSCLCICGGLGLKFWSTQAEKCDDDGTCLIVERLKPFKEIKINQQFIIIRKLNNYIEIKEIL